jgi:serine/threonine-protein kinase
MADSDRSDTDSLVGKLLSGRYRVKRLLGKGGMAEVYEGEHEKLGKRVAIKVLHPELAGDEGMIERFLREAQSEARIEHPHIVAAFDWGETPDAAPYAVLEFLDGRDWEKDLERADKPSVQRVAAIVCQVCEALEAAHARGIIHRDLKPANVFLIDRDGNPDYVKVVDFGIAKLLHQGRDTPKLTEPGGAPGTPLYMAPEQLSQQAVDARTDVWAIGVMLYEALAGKVPFNADTIGVLVMKVLTETPQLQDLRPEVPDPIRELVQRMLAKDPAGRPESCEEVRRVLEPYARGTAQPPGNAAQLQPTAPSPRLPAAPKPVPVAPHGESPRARGMIPDEPPQPSRSGSLPQRVFSLAAVAAIGGTAVAFSNSRSSSPEPPATVLLTVNASPADAEITLGGRKLDNPYSGREPRSEVEQWLVVSAPGYVASRETITLSRDRDRRINLERSPAEPAPQPVPAQVSLPAAARPRSSRVARPNVTVGATETAAPASAVPSAPALPPPVAPTPAPPAPAPSREQGLKGERLSADDL